MTGTVGITGTPTVLVGNSVTIGSLPAVSFSGTPTVAISGTVPVTGTVGITGTPTVLVGNSVTIGSLPAVSLSGTPLVLIGNPISISGTPTVVISTTVPMTGTVGITGSPTVLIGNSVTIGSIPAVSLSGTPTVAISSGSPVTVTVSQALPVSIAGHGFTSILVTAISTGGLISLGGFNTPGIDISQFSEYSYGVHAESSGLATTYTVQPQVAPILNNNYYANSGNPGTINVTLLGGTTNVVLTNNDFLRYSRLAISGGGVGAVLNLTVYFQGQY